MSTEQNHCSQEQEIRSLFDVEPRPWQTYGVRECLTRFNSDKTRPWCVAGPTGSGKSLTMSALIKYAIKRNFKVAMFVNRNLLYEQTTRGMDAAGIDYGCRGAAFAGQENGGAPVQICSVSTEAARVFKSRDKAVEAGEMEPEYAKYHWGLPAADLVLIDEIHMNAGPTMGKIVSEYLETGAAVICFTATPLGINHICDELIVAGTKRECREYGALVPAIVYGSPELDMSKVTAKDVNADGEFSQKIKKQIWSSQIFGYIFQEWKRVNPDARMALGFGPDVAGSTWLAQHFHDPAKYFQDHQRALKFLNLGREWEVAAAEEFYRHGVSAAHIDGSNVWVDGHEYKNDKQARQDVLARWQDNEIKIMWNRWVLREGLDFPDLYHGILASPIGKVTTYDQIVGRFLRHSSATPDAVIISDHCANYVRHGSPNADRDWHELFDMSPKAVTDLRFEQMRDKKIKQPIVCKKCGAYRVSGPKCWKCGHESSMTSRLVLQKDGSLKEVNTNGIRPRSTTQKANTQKLWDDMYWSAYKAHRKLEKEVANLQSKVDAGDKLAEPILTNKRDKLETKLNRAMTFNQVYSRFFLEYGYFPPRDLANMPTKDTTWFRRVRDTDHCDVKMPENQPSGNGRESQSTLNLDELPKPF